MPASLQNDVMLKPAAPSAGSPGLAHEGPWQVEFLLKEDGMVGRPSVSVCLNRNTPNPAPRNPALVSVPARLLHKPSVPVRW